MMQMKQRLHNFVRPGTTSHLPMYFAGAVLAATVIDIIAAILGIAAQPDSHEGDALQLISSFSRPGMSLLVLIGLLMFARWRGDVADQRALSASSTNKEPRDTPAAKVAGWISIVGGAALGAAWTYFGSLIWIDAQRELGDAAREAIPLIIGFVAAALVVSGIPVWLGVLVLLGRRWARYALIVFSALAAVGIYFWPLAQSMDMLVMGVIIVPVLLIWSELRGAGLAGSFRDSWRGLPLLIVTGHIFGFYAFVATGIGDESGIAGFVFGLMTVWVFLFALFPAMWAVNKDDNALWAGLNAALVTFAPLALAFIGLISNLVELLMPLTGS